MAADRGERGGERVGMREVDGTLLGTLWQRNPPGREVVKIERAWTYFGDPSVRAHPITGGRPLVAPIDWFREHYTQVRLAPAHPQEPTDLAPEDSGERGGAGE